MPINLPKFKMPTKGRAQKEIEKVEGGLLLQGVFLITLLVIHAALPEDELEDKA